MPNIANIWDSDSDDEGGLEGMSPPKTMQFHVPQTRLLRTPGKSCLSFFFASFFIFSLDLDPHTIHPVLPALRLLTNFTPCFST